MTTTATVADTAAPKPTEAPQAPPQPWPGSVPGSHRMGYVGPGVPLYSLSGPRPSIRERWGRHIRPLPTLTATCHRVAAAGADHGDRDGSHIYPSQKLLAEELGLSTGTISRAVREGEDAGIWQVKRSKPRRDPKTGRFGRKSNNYYILCIPPGDAEARGIKGQRKARHGSPADARRGARERRWAQTLARLAASVGEEEAQRLADSQALGAFRPARNDTCPCGSRSKSKACCGAERGPGTPPAPVPGESVPPSPPTPAGPASEPTGLPSSEEQTSEGPGNEEPQGPGNEEPQGPGNDASEGSDEPIARAGRPGLPEDRPNPWTAIKQAHHDLLDGHQRHGP